MIQYIGKLVLQDWRNARGWLHNQHYWDNKYHPIEDEL